MLLSLLLAAAQSAPLTTTGPWRVDAEENLCLLSRNYGPVDAGVTLAFQPVFRTPRMEVMLLTPGVGTTASTGEGTIITNPGKRRFGGTFYVIPLPQRKQRLTRITVDRALFDELTDGTEIAIKAGGVSTKVRVAKPAPALSAFAACERDLLTSWGINPATLDVAQPASVIGNAARVFGSDAYPFQAWQAGISGRVVAVLQLDTAGAVANCRITSSAGKLLNDGTCTAARRLRFQPARDAGGQPVPSIYVLPVRWVLPDGPPRNTAATRIGSD